MGKKGKNGNTPRNSSEVISVIPIEITVGNPKIIGNPFEKNKKNSHYKLIFYNNDSTAVELVLFIIVNTIGKPINRAIQLVKLIELQGKGVVNSYNNKKEAIEKRLECLMVCKKFNDSNLKIEVEEEE